MRIAIAGATGLVGARLTSLARSEGHDVVELTRSRGVDLTGDQDLEPLLRGVDVVVDVTNPPTTDGLAQIEFFTTVAERLGAAATAAGVRRTVLLSINGIGSHSEGHYAAKLRHEEATRAHAPGVVVLRAAQFHEFAGQTLAWGRDGDTTSIPDLPVQPVALDTVVRTLLDLAVVDDVPAHTDLVGPRVERLVDMVERLARRDGIAVTVTPSPVGPEAAAGSMLGGPGAVIAGPDFATWLAAGEAPQDR